MRERHSPNPTPGRPLTIQPTVAANGACWRRQAVSVVSGSGTASTTANSTTPTGALTAAPGDGPPPQTEPCGDRRTPIQEKS